MEAPFSSLGHPSNFAAPPTAMRGFRGATPPGTPAPSAPSPPAHAAARLCTYAAPSGASGHNACCPAAAGLTAGAHAHTLRRHGGGRPATGDAIRAAQPSGCPRCCCASCTCRRFVPPRQVKLPQCPQDAPLTTPQSQSNQAWTAPREGALTPRPLRYSRISRCVVHQRHDCFLPGCWKTFASPTR